MPATDPLTTDAYSENLYPHDAQFMMDHYAGRNDFVLIDVSTPWEYTGRRLEHARNVSFLSPAFRSRIQKLDKAHTYLLYCKMGCRSKAALRAMKKIGFQDVHHITGGIVLWEDEGLPLRGGGKKETIRFCPMFYALKMWRWVQGIFGVVKHPTGADCQCKCLSTGPTENRPATRK